MAKVYDYVLAVWLRLEIACDAPQMLEGLREYLESATTYQIIELEIVEESEYDGEDQFTVSMQLQVMFEESQMDVVVQPFRAEPNDQAVAEFDRELRACLQAEYHVSSMEVLDDALTSFLLGVRGDDDPIPGGLAMPDGVNIGGLREMYSNNAVARAFLDRAAQRERDRAETTVERALAVLRDEGSDPSRGDVVGLFQQLEELECGKFILGRRGKPSRFAWSVSITDVGRAAVGEQQTVTEIPETEAEEEAIDTLTHTYHLRTDKAVSIDLPSDLTPNEADRLAAFIKSLPMED